MDCVCVCGSAGRQARLHGRERRPSGPAGVEHNDGAGARASVTGWKLPGSTRQLKLLYAPIELRSTN